MDYLILTKANKRKETNIHYYVKLIVSYWFNIYVTADNKPWIFLKTAVHENNLNFPQFSERRV